MSLKEIAGIGVFVAVITGGPIYVLTHGPDKKEATSKSSTLGVHTNQDTKTDEQPKVTVPSFDKSKYSHDDASSIWVVVNKQRPLSPKAFAPTDLVSVGGGQQMRAEPATELKKMIADAKLEGLTINPLSGYRSYYTQVSVYNREVQQNGQAVADTQSARPGTSEHQTGLAVDVGGGGCGIEDCFGNTTAGKWVAANAHKYGFIIRYTADKQQVTGYRAEPWHLRYIGTELSAEMQKQGVKTLEEFFDLPAAPSY